MDTNRTPDPAAGGPRTEDGKQNAGDQETPECHAEASYGESGLDRCVTLRSTD